jgi:RNA recognition motif-containing protein
LANYAKAQSFVRASLQCAPQMANSAGEKCMKVYVGNLPWSITDTDLLDLFRPFGDVDSAQVVTDRESGRSRGFGFVEMAAQHANQAIAKLNGRAIESRELRVNEAQSKQRA